MPVQSWQESYPWLQLAFRQFGAGGRAASEEWQWRIEEDLRAPLDYQVRSDRTAAVWCGLTRHDFTHEPTPKELMQGLDAAYRKELERRGWLYPNLRAPVESAEQEVTITTRYGPVTISWAARNALLEAMRDKEGEFTTRVFDAIGASRPVNLDRKGKIVLLDAIWTLAERSTELDPQIRELQDKLTEEISKGR
jgi:hypothetical protein